MSNPLDPVTAHAIEAAIADDEAFKRVVKHIAIQGLKKLNYYLEAGTPEVQVRIAMLLGKIYQAALEKETVPQGLTMEDRVRTMLQSVLTPEDEKDESIEGVEEEDER